MCDIEKKKKKKDKNVFFFLEKHCPFVLGAMDLIYHQFKSTQIHFNQMTPDLIPLFFFFFLIKMQSYVSVELSIFKIKSLDDRITEIRQCLIRIKPFLFSLFMRLE